MITLPTWTLLLVGALIAVAMYLLGSLKRTESHQAGYEDGHYQGYYDGYADCLVRARSCEQTEESEVGDAS